MRRVLQVAFLVVLVLLLAVTVAPLLFPWSPLNCWHQDVDIASGRIRTQWYLLCVKVSESVAETPLSEALARSEQSDRNRGSAPQWRRVNTFSPGLCYSPHYAYHGALSQIDQLAELWQLNFPEELKATTARHVLALWQEGSDDKAGDYLRELPGVLDPAQREALLASLADLKMPRFETTGHKTVKTLYYPSGLPMERCEGYRSAAGEFVPDGVWEMWNPAGQRTLYGHFRSGLQHGPRFEWDRGGALLAIAEYTGGQLTQYESEQLSQHPHFALAEEVRLDAGQPQSR